MLNDFFKKERIGLNIIKEINKKDKRLRVYDLFYQDNSHLIFGDGQKVVGDLITELKQL